MKYAILLIMPIIYLVLLGCFNNNSSKFYRIKLLENSHLYKERSDYIEIYEAFVITKVPKDFQKLKILVDSFNIENPISIPIQTNYGILRMFYRETSFTPKNYQETNPKDDCLDFHIEDLVLITHWNKMENKRYLEYVFYKNSLIVKTEHKEKYTNK